MRRAAALLLFVFNLAAPVTAADRAPIEALFLGDSRAHHPADRAAQLIPAMAERGIRVDYTERVQVLNPKDLARYDALLLYANIDEIASDQEKALLDWVAAGGAFVPIHCASFCFRNSEKFVELVGAQFRRHGRGVFTAEIVDRDHSVTKGFREFATWDETYVHHLHNSDRQVLMERVEGDHREPWTWTRTHGKGRVFYTAYGHDQRTWSHPAFQQLIERGIRWAVGHEETLVPVGQPEKPFEFREARIAYYAPGKGRVGDGPWNQMQLPLDAAESRQHLQVPPGFQVDLFAADPEIFKPLSMAWDESSRLWISETKDYPNEQRPEGAGRDRITICEDTDGDGRADRFKVFADKLSIPTSIVFANGGILVTQVPNILFLKDTDGDDRADVREVFLTGFSTRDTHAGPSNLRWGHDNWIWGTIGYDRFHGQVGGKELTLRQCLFRFRPDGSEMEFMRSTTNNTWGLGFSEEGFVFASTANGNPSVHFPLANRYYDNIEDFAPERLATIADDISFFPVTDKVRQVDWHGAYTAAAGHALYTARSFPPQYWNRMAFVTGPTGHLVGKFALERRGSEFVARNERTFLASDDEWTAPIQAEVGPDGALWVIDWYNFIVQHNPTPRGFEKGRGNAYETDLRDKVHGRIYRVTHRDSTPSTPVRLDDRSTPELIAALRHDNMLWRLHAQRLLVERGDVSQVTQLVAAVFDPNVDALGLNVGAIHALWTLHGLGLLDGTHELANAAVLHAVSHASPGVRRTAAKVLPRNTLGASAILSGKLLEDPSAHVRLEALLALAETQAPISTGAAVFAMLRERRNFDDRWIPHAATAAAVAQPRGFLEAALHGGEVEPEVGNVVALVAHSYAAEASLADVVPLLTISGAGAETLGGVLGGLAAGWPVSPHRLDAATERALEDLMSRLPNAHKDRLIALARRLGRTDLFATEVDAARGYLLERLSQEGLDGTEILALGKRLLELEDGAESVRAVLRAVTPQTPLDVGRALLEALKESRADATGAILTEEWARVTPRMRRNAIAVLLRRPVWTASMLDGIESGALSRGDLTDQAWQQVLTHPDATLQARARKIGSGAIADPDRQKVLDTLIHLADRTGDAALGKQIFEKKCAQCHTINGAGGYLGPELTGINHRPRADVLTELIDPNRSVEGNYRQWTAILRDGGILTGLLVSESATSIAIRDANGDLQPAERRDVAQLTPSKISLMPVGLEKDLRHEELTALLEYLASDEVDRKK